MNKLAISERESDSLKGSKESLRHEIKENFDKWKYLKKINRNWDARLTISTIVLTLLITILATEGIKIDENFKKINVGILGAVVVAIQSIGNAFPVKQRAGGYRTLEAQIVALDNDLEVAETADQLSEIRKQLNGLIIEAARLEQ